MPKKIHSGSIYQRKYHTREGRVVKTKTWHVKYYVKGKSVQVSTGTEDYDEALAMLRKRTADASTYESYSMDQPERVRLGQLFDLLVDDYRYRGRKSTYDMTLRVTRHLRPFFGERKAPAVGTSVLRQY